MRHDVAINYRGSPARSGKPHDLAFIIKNNRSVNVRVTGDMGISETET